MRKCLETWKMEVRLTLVDVGRIGLFARTLALLLVVIASCGLRLFGGPGGELEIPKPQKICSAYFFAAFAPSVDLAGAFPAVEAGAFCAVDVGLGGIVMA